MIARLKPKKDPKWKCPIVERVLYSAIVHGPAEILVAIGTLTSCRSIHSYGSPNAFFNGDVLVHSHGQHIPKHHLLDMEVRSASWQLDG